MLRMRAVVQRVSRASVSVEGAVVGAIGRGLLVLVGVTHGDSEADARALADKLVGLRVFADDDDKMNRSVVDVDGSCLVVSQFTLYGSVRRGRRPSFTDAADPTLAEGLVASVVAGIAAHGVEVSEGRFGAMMQVDSLNEGPVTLIVEAVDGRVI